MAIFWGNRVRAALLASLFSATPCFAQPTQAATDEERAAARSLAEQGASAYGDKRFQDAVDLFSRAERVIHSPVHLLFIARANAELGALVKAQEAYVKITREELGPDAPDAFQSAATEAAAELEVLRPRIPKLTVHIQGAEASEPQLLIDGEAVPAALIGVPIPVDPGRRKLEARADGMQPASQEVAVGEGQTAELELVLTPVPVVESDALETPAPADAVQDDGGGQTMRYLAYGAFGVGAVGLGVGTVFLLSASSADEDANDLFDGCDPGCSEAEQIKISELDDDAASDRTLSLTGFIVGGVGVGAGVALLLLSSGDESASNEPRVTPWIGYKSVGVSGTF